MAALEREIATFNAKLPELLKHIGKFVLIKDEQIEGYFDDYAAALTAGYSKHKPGEFLVKKVAPAEFMNWMRDFPEFAQFMPSDSALRSLPARESEAASEK